jgi:hypothetical protein
MATLVTYNLSDIPGFNESISSLYIDSKYDKYFSIHPYSTKSNEKYSIIRYNKDFLINDLISTYGLLRSLILSNNQIVSFSPPKSMSADSFIKKYPVKSDAIIAEQFIEGTMINVFYDKNYGVNGCWQIATRNTVGANVSFYKWTTKTFNDMFIDACESNNFNLNTLNPQYCYSFVLQHPDNRIVIPFKQPQLYLVSVYKIIQQDNNIIVQEQDIEDVKSNGLWSLTTIKFAEKYDFTNYTDLIEKFASTNTPYDIVGVNIKNKETGERFKIRNPIYEQVRQLRGNQPKLQYQYLCLRHSGQLPEFLKYYPETKSEMSKYREQVHMFTKTLHKNYISCYIKKEKPLIQFSDQYRTHMFKIHEIFLNDLREKKLFVTDRIVMKYVNELQPSLLMYCLNFHMRKRRVDKIKADIKICDDGL